MKIYWRTNQSHHVKWYMDSDADTLLQLQSSSHQHQSDAQHSYNVHGAACRWSVERLTQDLDVEETTRCGRTMYTCTLSFLCRTRLPGAMTATRESYPWYGYDSLTASQCRSTGLHDLTQYNFNAFFILFFSSTS